MRVKLDSFFAEYPWGSPMVDDIYALVVDHEASALNAKTVLRFNLVSRVGIVDCDCTDRLKCKVARILGRRESDVAFIFPLSYFMDSSLLGPFLAVVSEGFSTRGESRPEIVEMIRILKTEAIFQSFSKGSITKISLGLDHVAALRSQMLAA